MKTFKQLKKPLQLAAIKEFEAQGLTPNLDLPINAIEGNFDWKNALQPYEFWYTLAYKGENRAMEFYIESDPAPKPQTKTKAAPKTTKKTAKKTTKKAAKNDNK